MGPGSLLPSQPMGLHLWATSLPGPCPTRILWSMAHIIHPTWRLGHHQPNPVFHTPQSPSPAITTSVWHQPKCLGNVFKYLRGHCEEELVSQAHPTQAFRCITTTVTLGNEATEVLVEAWSTIRDTPNAWGPWPPSPVW